MRRDTAGIHEPAGAAPPPRGFSGRLALVLETIKFRHSVFALPFALAAMLVAAQGLPTAATVFWIVVACVAARSMAMAYNRLVDRRLDATNPRTAGRALPAGRLGPRFTAGFVLANALLFLLAAAMLNPLCLALAPLVIAWLLLYSHGKRLTVWVHLMLGAALGLAPLGAWVAVRGTLEGLPLLLAAGVCFWTAGFDLIYACLDIDHDRREGLRAIPARHGAHAALALAARLHALCVLCFGLFLWQYGLGPWSWAALALAALLLAVESRLVRPDDLSRVGPAFFGFNAAVSLLFLAGIALDLLAG